MADGDGGVIINVSSSGALVPLAGGDRLLGREGGAERHDRVAGARVRPEGAGQLDLGRPVPHRHLQGLERGGAGSGPATRCGRPGRPEEIVTTALYLASPASSFTTGAIVRCDGGQS